MKLTVSVKPDRWPYLGFWPLSDSPMIRDRHSAKAQTVPIAGLRKVGVEEPPPPFRPPSVPELHVTLFHLVKARLRNWQVLHQFEYGSGCYTYGIGGNSLIPRLQRFERPPLDSIVVTYWIVWYSTPIIHVYKVRVLYSKNWMPQMVSMGPLGLGCRRPPPRL